MVKFGDYIYSGWDILPFGLSRKYDEFQRLKQIDIRVPTSSYPGISYCSRIGKWDAAILKSEGVPKHMWLGRYPTELDAWNVKKLALVSRSFTPPSGTKKTRVW